MALRVIASILINLVGVGCIIVAGLHDWRIALAAAGLMMIFVASTQIDLEPPKKPEVVRGEVEEEEAVGFRTRSGGR